MGTNVFLDIIGSVIIGGILLITLFRLSGRATENTYNKSGDLTIQQNIASIVRVFENDFRKIGYCADWKKMPDPQKSIILADVDKFKFLADIDKNGTMDTIYYYIGPTSELIYTANPRDRFLYRVVNSEKPAQVNLGVTQFSLTYYDVSKDLIKPPIYANGGLYTIQVDLAVENVEAYNQKYSTVFWRQIRLVAKNLKYR